MTAALEAITPPEICPVRTELTAMRSITAALEHLPSDEARARVLQWAAQFFEVRQAPAPAASQQPASRRFGQSRNADPYLAVAELSSLFGPRPSPAEVDEFEPIDEERAAADAASDSDRSVASMVQSFVADFQKLACDWQG